MHSNYCRDLCQESPYNKLNFYSITEFIHIKHIKVTVMLGVLLDSQIYMWKR